MLSSLKKDKNRRILVKKFEIKRLQLKVFEQDLILKEILEKNIIQINTKQSFVRDLSAISFFKKSDQSESNFQVNTKVRFGEPLNEKHFLKNNSPLATLNNDLTKQNSLLDLHSFLHMRNEKVIPRNSSKNRIRNRCIESGRSRAVVRFCRLSRIRLREKASKGDIPGVSKASW